MPIFQAYIEPGSFLTLVVRAADEQKARKLAEDAAQSYNPENRVTELEHLDPDGPEGVLVDDPS